MTVNISFISPCLCGSGSELKFKVRYFPPHRGHTTRCSAVAEKAPCTRTPIRMHGVFSATTDRLCSFCLLATRKAAKRAINTITSDHCFTPATDFLYAVWQ